MRSNLHWAVAYNLVGIVAAASGYLHPILAAVLMAASSALVGWRSLHLLELSSTAEATRASRPWLAEEHGQGVRAAFHWAGMLGQAIVLARLADLSPITGFLLVAAFAIGAYATPRLWRRMPSWADMTWAMITLGGLGMNLGWWIDQRFTPAIAHAQVKTCCAMAMNASVSHSSHWMYWAMLLAGVPAMYLLRRTPEVFSLRRWCCAGPLVLGVPGMCFGMWAGAQLATHVAGLSPNAQVLVSYLLMMLGMVTGMLVPHSLELMAPSDRPAPPPAAPPRPDESAR